MALNIVPIAINSFVTGYVCSIGALQYLLGKYMYSHYGFTINPTPLLEALRGKMNDKM